MQVDRTQFRNWHGQGKEKNYFEGWYLKHQKGTDGNGKEMLALIPSFHLDKFGRGSCSLQIITSDQAYQLSYAEKDFSVAEHGFYIKMGNNIFTQRGMVLDINEPELTCSGEIFYGVFTPLDYDIMGPFALIPFMECNHGVISLGHDLQGQIILNGRTIDFSDGIGYIEKDWGTSFPERYTWIEWSGKIGQENACVMVSAAKIPFGGFAFTGFLAVVSVGGREYRFATYNGAKLKYRSAQGVWLQKGEMALIVSNLEGKGHLLDAPQKGKMARKIEECPFCSGKILFSIGEETILDVTSEMISFECVE